MKALAITERAENQPFTLINVPTPVCGTDEVLIRNHFVGVNRGDVVRRKRALFPDGLPAPYVLGFEGVGEVVDVGTRVSRLAVGDTVGYLIPRGAFAELVAVHETIPFRKPDQVAAETLAASCCVGLTAIGLLDAITNPGDKTILVHAASGSVGSALLQLGWSRGLNMIATVTLASDIATAPMASGGVLALDEGDFADALLARTQGRGVDIIIDCLGEAVLEGNIRALSEHGTLLYYGSTSGHASFPGHQILMKALRIQGFVVFNCAADIFGWQSMTNRLLQYLSDRILAPQVQIVHPSELTDIVGKIQARSFRGRAVLDMRLLSPESCQTPDNSGERNASLGQL